MKKIILLGFLVLLGVLPALADLEDALVSQVPVIAKGGSQINIGLQSQLTNSEFRTFRRANRRDPLTVVFDTGTETISTPIRFRPFRNFPAVITFTVPELNINTNVEITFNGANLLAPLDTSLFIVDTTSSEFPFITRAEFEPAQLDLEVLNQRAEEFDEQTQGAIEELEEKLAQAKTPEEEEFFRGYISAVKNGETATALTQPADNAVGVLRIGDIAQDHNGRLVVLENVFDDFRLDLDLLETDVNEIKIFIDNGNFGSCVNCVTFDSNGDFDLGPKTNGRLATVESDVDDLKTRQAELDQQREDFIEDLAATIPTITDPEHKRQLEEYLGALRNGEDFSSQQVTENIGDINDLLRFTVTANGKLSSVQNDLDFATPLLVPGSLIRRDVNGDFALPPSFIAELNGLDLSIRQLGEGLTVRDDALEEEIALIGLRLSGALDANGNLILPSSVVVRDSNGDFDLGPKTNGRLATIEGLIVDEAAAAQAANDALEQALRDAIIAGDDNGAAAAQAANDALEQALRDAIAAGDDVAAADAQAANDALEQALRDAIDSLDGSKQPMAADSVDLGNGVPAHPRLVAPGVVDVQGLSLLKLVNSTPFVLPTPRVDQLVGADDGQRLTIIMKEFMEIVDQQVGAGLPVPPPSGSIGLDGNASPPEVQFPPSTVLELIYCIPDPLAPSQGFWWESSRSLLD